MSIRVFISKSFRCDDPFSHVCGFVEVYSSNMTHIKVGLGVLRYDISVSRTVSFLWTKFRV